jgi:KDO2-lipid IV(A) lauroyltransferase
VFDREHAQLAHARLAAVLQQNGIVCITASQHEGVSLAETEFLKGRIRLATGAPKTAYRAGCSILPVFVLRDRNEPLAYSLVIEHPLDLPNTAECDEAVKRAIADFVERLERYVIAYPDMWVGWRRLGMLAK